MSIRSPIIARVNSKYLLNSVLSSYDDASLERIDLRRSLLTLIRMSRLPRRTQRRMGQENVAESDASVARASHRGGADWKLHLIPSTSLAIGVERANFSQALPLNDRNNNESGVKDGPAE
jgi:hypothetical protein